MEEVDATMRTIRLFLLVEATLLGLRADAPNHRLYVDPALPDWLPDLALSGLRVGRARLDVRAWREGDRTAWDATVTEGEVDVRQEPWTPWAA